MPDQHPPREFEIANPVRRVVFVLTYVQLFLLANWLLPESVALSVAVVLLLSLVLIALVPSFRREAELQICDRIRLTKFGVEYDSGVFGDDWVRPYDEFRVDCQPAFGPTKKYLVKLKHRVLANVTVGRAMRLEAAQQTVDQLVDNSDLKKLRRD